MSFLIYCIAFYGSLILFLVSFLSVISLARKNGLEYLGVKYSITSFLFAVLTYFSFQALATICYFIGCSGRPKLFAMPIDLWLLLILSIFSLIFSIRAWRAGAKNLAILLIILEVLVVFNTFMAILAAAWINAML